MVTINKFQWRYWRAPNCVYLHQSTHPARHQVFQLIRQGHYNYWLQWNYCPLKAEGCTNLKPSFSSQVWSGLIMGSFSLSLLRRASRMWKWRGVSMWSTADQPSSGKRPSAGRTFTMKVRRKRECDVSGNKKHCACMFLLCMIRGCSRVSTCTRAE